MPVRETYYVYPPRQYAYRKPVKKGLLLFLILCAIFAVMTLGYTVAAWKDATARLYSSNPPNPYSVIPEKYHVPVNTF